MRELTGGELVEVSGGGKGSGDCKNSSKKGSSKKGSSKKGSSKKGSSKKGSGRDDYDCFC